MELYLLSSVDSLSPWQFFLEAYGRNASCHHPTSSTTAITSHKILSDGPYTISTPLKAPHIRPHSKHKSLPRAKFQAVFEIVRAELLDHFAAQGMPTEAVAWYRNVCSSVSFL